MVLSGKGGGAVQGMVLSGVGVLSVTGSGTYQPLPQLWTDRRV